MTVRIAELEIDPSQLSQCIERLQEEISASLALEPGVKMLKAVALSNARNMIRLLEVYESEEAYEMHIQSPHFLKYKSATADMVVSLRLLDAVPIAI